MRVFRANGRSGGISCRDRGCLSGGLVVVVCAALLSSGISGRVVRLVSGRW